MHSSLDGNALFYDGELLFFDWSVNDMDPYILGMKVANRETIVSTWRRLDMSRTRHDDVAGTFQDASRKNVLHEGNIARDTKE